MMTPDVTIAILSAIEPPLPECLAPVEAQVGGPYPVVRVHDVFPMAAAFNAMADRCQTKYIVQVDGDVALHVGAVETLLYHIRRMPWAYVVWGQLFEMGFGLGGSVRIWRRWPLRLFRFRDRRCVDRDLHARIRWTGMRRVQIKWSDAPDEPFGTHYPRHSEFARFSKAKNDAIKWLHLGRTDLHEAFRHNLKGDWREETYPERLGLYAASISTTQERSKNLQEDWWEYQRLCASYSRDLTSSTGVS